MSFSFEDVGSFIVNPSLAVNKLGFDALSSAGKKPDAPHLVGYEGQFPEVPELTPYTGPTWVPVPKGYRDIEKTVTGLITDPNSSFNKVLSGDPNMELFNKGVEIPMQQKLTTQTLPQIRAQYGGGDGTSVHSGAAREAEVNAIQDSYNKLAELRLQYGDTAVKNMLSASGQLPAFANIFSTDQQMLSQNLNRKIQTHFQNENLKVQAFQMSAQQLGMVNQVGMFNTGIENQNAMIDYQSALAEQARTASLLSTIGSIGGAVAGGSVGGPMGAIAGSTIGAQVGSVAGGGSASPSSVTDLLSTYLLMDALNGKGGTGTPVTTSPSTTPSANFIDVPNFEASNGWDAPSSDLSTSLNFFKI